MKTLAISTIFAVLIPVALLFAVDCFTHKRFAFVRLSSVNAARGRSLFGSNCKRCHNLDDSPYQKLGPNLAPVRNREHIVGGKSLSVPHYVLQSILEPDAYRVPGFGVMPKNVVSHLTDDQVKDLVAYVSGPSHERAVSEMAIPERSPPEPPININIAEASLGESVFREKGKCTTCHSYYQLPEYHALAPNLLTGAYKNVEELKRHIANPSAAVAEEYKSTQVQTVDGLIFSGRRIMEGNDANTIKLLVANPAGGHEITTIPTEDIETDDEGNPLVRVLTESPMPADFAQQLTADELEAVAKLIASLNE